jgi:hypothetical protein
MAEETNSGFWLSPQQKHLWLAHPDGETPNAVLLALLEGPLNPDRLRQAWSEIMSRHEVLRSVFRRMPGMKVPFQIVLPAGEALWETTGFENLDEAAWSLQLENLVGQERNRRFDLNAGPLVHVWLAGLASNRWALILSLPALSSDSYSLGILAEKLFSSYCGSEEPSEEQLRYVQFAQWQNDLLESGGEGDEQLAKKFWSRFQSAELAAPALPQEAEGSGSCEIARLSTTLASSVVSRFQSISDKHGSSDAHLMLAAWQVLLWRISGQPDFVTGMLSSGREYEELKNAPGLIAKTLPIPARFDGDYRFEEVLQHVRDAARWSCRRKRRMAS